MIKIDCEDFNIQKIGDSGQCFRLNDMGSYWLNIAGDRALKVYGNKLDCTKAEYNAFWGPYFDLETDYSAFRDKIPASDKFLSKAADFGQGKCARFWKGRGLICTIRRGRSRLRFLPMRKNCRIFFDNSFFTLLLNDIKIYRGFVFPFQDLLCCFRIPFFERTCKGSLYPLPWHRLC